MQEILGAPAQVLAAAGPDDARQAATPQAHQPTERLPHGAFPGALLWECAAPFAGNGQKLGEQAHRDSGRKANVFFSGRRMRSRIRETCRGARAFLSMSNAIST